MTETTAAAQVTPRRTGKAAALVGAGILLSRALGLVRQSLQARYLGGINSVAADAFTAAFKIPNILQNLFGEGALSASFIPVYSGLLARDDREAAGRVAGAVAAILGLVVAVFVLVGVVFTPELIGLIAQGFTGERRELTIRLTRILFPGAGIFVLSAWCLGVLNSHRRFLLSYAAPALWNVAMIGALVWFGRSQPRVQLAVTLAWASVVGAGLQFLVQLPSVFRLVPSFRMSLGRGSAHVRLIVVNFVPAFVSRGVVQISAYIDQWLASFLPVGMVALLGYAQSVYVLPVSLFAMSVSAAELPEMSSALGAEEERAREIRARVARGLRLIAYFVVPSAVAFLALGDVVASTLFEYGAFGPDSTRFSWGILAGSGVGLLAATLGRLYSSTFYALHDTRSPLRFALLRVLLATTLGYVAAIHVPRWIGIDPRWGAAGLTSAGSLAAWVEFAMLRSRLTSRVGATNIPMRDMAPLWLSALLAAGAAFGLKLALSGARGPLRGAVVLATFAAVYGALTLALGVPEARSTLGKMTRRR
jgi:putative peptidoglycan lipid II flippase